MIRRLAWLLIIVVVAGCGPQVHVETEGQESNCRRIAEIAEAGRPPGDLDLGSVRPPLPDGLNGMRGVILEPQPLPRESRPPDAPTVGMPRPDRRSVVIVGDAVVSPSEVRRRFERELDTGGMDRAGGLMEVKIGDDLDEFSVAYRGKAVEGAASVLRCGRSSKVIVSQTLVP